MPDSVQPLRPDVLLAQAGWVRGLARALVLDASRVDDVVQKTWLAALERPRAEVGNVRGWLAGIVRNVVRQERRSEARRDARERDARQSEPLPPVVELVERAELLRRVVQAVLELEEPYRSTLLLRYFEELPAEEIARRLGLPGSTVRSRLHVALETLRERFDRERDGDRRAWSLGLIPLVLPRANAGAVLVSSSAAGVLAMILKGILVISLAAGLGLGAFRVLARPEPPAREPARAAPSEPAPALAAEAGVVPELQERARQPVVSSPGAVRVKGRVLDLAGAPAAGALVFVGGQPSPFQPVEAGLRLVIGYGEERRRAANGEPGEDYHEEEAEGLEEWAAIAVERLKKHGTVLGKNVVADGEGRFEAAVPAGARVYVTVYPQLGFHGTANGAWHAAAAEGLELRVKRVPTAELAIWVTDLTTGKKLAFAGELFGPKGHLAEWEAGGEVVRREVELPPDAPARFRVEVAAPAWARTTHEFAATPGIENAVELLVRSGAGFAGEVVDAQGLPVEGAFVFWGELEDMRQGSLFRAYEPERVPGGVRTDATGHFTLPGTAARVSAWHPGHGPASAAAQDAARLVLPARGAIRGVVLDERGLPAPGKKATLDRSREALTDAQGVFAFENVEAGVHGVGHWPERFVGVVVAPGETIEIPPADLVEARGELTTGGVPFLVDTGGVIIGLGRIFSVSEWGNDQGRLEAGRVRAGRHLLVSGAGILHVLDARSEAAPRIELGTARVTLETDEGDPVVYLLPEEASAHPAARFFGSRSFREREGGKLQLGPLAAGRYVIVVAGRDGGIPLDVAEGQELVIPRERWLESGSRR